jgi:WW domain
VLADKIRDAAAAAGDNTLEQLRMRSTEKRQAEANIAEQQRLALEAINAAKKRKADEAAAAAGELAPDWQAVTDANGQTYYWNTVTQVTTWLRPVAGAAVPPPPPPPPPALPPQAAAPAAAAASLQQAAPAAVVNSSGTGSSSSAHQQAAQNAVPVAAEPALPAGWKEVRHAATGQLFWVHEETKERFRVRPTEDVVSASTSSSSSSSSAASSQPAAKRAKPSAGPVGPQLPGRR